MFRSSAPRQQLGDCGLAGVVGAFDDFSFDITGEDDVEAAQFLAMHLAVRRDRRW